MTRINAGSTLANQYAPPFVVSKSVATNWQLRYNANILAFEAFDPNENVTAIGFDTIESHIVNVPLGIVQQQFVLPWVAASEASLYVTIDGLKQHTSAYSIIQGASTTTVTLAEQVDTALSNATVEFIGLQTTGGASIQLYTGIGNGSIVEYGLNWIAPSPQSLIVTVDGVKQQTNTYTTPPNSTFTGTTLTFSEAPGFNITSAAVNFGGTGYALNDILEVVGGTLRVGDQIFTAELVVTGVAGDAVTSVDIRTPGDYTALPSNPISVISLTGTGNDNATFNLTSTGEAIEVIGITTTGEVPASPVQATNRGGTYGLFRGKRVVGENQYLDFYGLAAGTNTTITINAANPNDAFYTIDTVPVTLANIGSGEPVAVIPGAGTDADFKRLFAATTDRIKLTSDANTITLTYAQGNVLIQGNATPYTMTSTDRIIGITNLTIPIQIDLVSAATLAPGDTITVKNKTAVGDAITLNAPGGEGIDGLGTKVISGAYAYITLYSDGSNYYIIAEG